MVALPVGIVFYLTPFPVTDETIGSCAESGKTGSGTLATMKLKSGWNPQALLQSPAFAPLHGLLAHLVNDRLPTLDELNGLCAQLEILVGVQNGKSLRFVEHVHGSLPFEVQYEPRCYLTGEVQTRPDSEHDLFNALVWLTFPETKAAINTRHYRALTGSACIAAGQRGSERDMLTLFDESGVIVVHADDELAGLLREFQWKELFWCRRDQVNAAMGFYLFGHGLYEKAMQPYPGITGQGLLLKVERAFFTWPLAKRLSHLDGLLAKYFLAPENCRNTRELTPLPLLGVPGWAAENNNPAYYEDTRYFRRRRRAALVN